jgi:hypothetical protein
VELQIGIAEYAIKIESIYEEEARKDKSDEQRSQNKKDKSKKKNERSSNNDDNKDSVESPKVGKEKDDNRDIIEILRNDKNFILLSEYRVFESID